MNYLTLGMRYPNVTGPLLPCWREHSLKSLRYCGLVSADLTAWNTEQSLQHQRHVLACAVSFTLALQFEQHYGVELPW